MSESESYSVTVTIPLYDSSSFIDDCLNSLLEQTHAPSEIIFVIDDRTTDNTEEIIRRRMSEFSNLRIVIQSDGKGLAGARNIGIKEAKSDVIWFLDVDDIPHPNFLEELLSIMVETDADTVICNHFQSFKRKMSTIPERDYSFRVYDGKYAVEHYTDFPIYSWSRIQKITVFNDNSMFCIYPAIEDIEQTIRQYSVSKKVCYYNKPLFTYVKRKTSASKTNRGKEIQSMEKIVSSLIPYVKKNVPESYDGFKIKILQNLIRQSTFSDYKTYSDNYGRSISHSIIREIDRKTMEMKIYSRFKLLYYLILFPFSHFIWDRKKGIWD